MPRRSCAGSQTLSLGRTLSRRPMNPLITRQYIAGSNTMLARIVLKKGARVPMHHHFHEQISHVVRRRSPVSRRWQAGYGSRGRYSHHSAQRPPRGDCPRRLGGARHLQSAHARTGSTATTRISGVCSIRLKADGLIAECPRPPYTIGFGMSWFKREDGEFSSSSGGENGPEAGGAKRAYRGACGLNAQGCRQPILPSGS